MSKVFRVSLSEQLGYYVDVEADTREEAMDTVRARLDDPKDDFQPIEDGEYFGGYVVDDAQEIDREIADLE